MAVHTTAPLEVQQEWRNAIETVELMILAHGLDQLTDELRDWIESDPEATRRALVSVIGYVPADPSMFVRMRTGRDRFPTGLL